MTLHGDMTRDVDRGPEGREVGAFFDFDRTLLAGYSAVDFFWDALRNGQFGPRELVETILTTVQFRLGQVGFSGFVAGTSGMLRGLEEEEFREISERLFEESLAANVYPEARALVKAHERKGHTLAVISSATRYQIEPLARDLGIDHVLCTRLEVREGRFTGEVVRPTCYGEGKAVAARELAAAEGLDLDRSYFYTDSDEDLPLLDVVGHPRPTNPNRRLTEIALKRGWPIRRFTSRGTPGLTEIGRTVLAVGSMAPAGLFSLPVGLLLGGSLRKGVNLATSTWGEFGTTIAGLDLQVRGQAHLWSHRPAVFVFNHQSAIDVLILCKLLKRDFVGISKEEVRRTLFGPVFALGGTVFIDRFNRQKAVDALKPAVDTLRQGLSIAIAPEGTRSPTPRLRPFKKGAFHLAMEAGVPVVPIVIRNALDALPKHGRIIHPTTVEVVIHPPVPTTDWTRETLTDEIEKIHRLYRETLGQ